MEVGVAGTARWNFCWARSSTALRRTCQPPPSYYSHLPLPRTVEDVHKRLARNDGPEAEAARHVKND